MKILVLNTGSSSVKYKLFDAKKEKELAKGVVERIGPGRTHEEAVRLALDGLAGKKHGVISDISEIGAVGHRVVHGGEEFSDSTVITPRVIKVIKEYCELAPLHNPPNLLGIKVAMKLLPAIKHVAVFDTAFHQTISPRAYLYGLPYRFYEKDKIRRYGFHGTSHKYVAIRTAEILKKPLDGLKIITCHLGNGCSITAVENGRSVNTSMGFTPLEGLVMGTRSGDIDPAIVFHIMTKNKLSAVRVEEILNKESGLLGVSGVSSDMRDVYERLKKGDKKARLAFEIFVERIHKYVGYFAVAMKGVDAIAFTAGIGENHAATRSAVCANLMFFGVKIDEARNKSSQKEKIINKSSSKVKILVVPTDEELMIAREAYRLVRA